VLLAGDELGRADVRPRTCDRGMAGLIGDLDIAVDDGDELPRHLAELEIT
jgi:hypothetical protein